jgi:cyanophycinase-like exopeptidase
MLICTAFTALACGGGDSGTGPDPDPVTGPCPDVPAGITLGGGGLVQDVGTTPIRRLVLMGGGLEEDFAATLFLEGAQGGNVVVLRATGSTTSYRDYFNFTLSPAPTPASVLVIRTDLPAAAADTAVLCRVNLAEAVWLAGGDQWDYLGRWPAELHQALDAVAGRDGAMGGISAGAMALGEAAFDAEEGTVTSAGEAVGPSTSTPRRPWL